MKKTARKKTEPMMRIQVQLPRSYQPILDGLRREGYSASGFLRGLLDIELQMRTEHGWSPWTGWPMRHGPQGPVSYPFQKDLKRKRNA